ncbi:MAG: peroxiredoxin [Bdellovibrionales bacterium]
MIPSLVLKNSQGENVDLRSFAGKKVILYFYPKDDTPGCTLEGQQFTALKEQFSQANAVVFGISRDTCQSHAKFIDKYNFQVELLADTDEKACQAFDVIKEKNMYGKMVMGIERSTFVFNEEQKLTHEFRKVQADGHAQMILDLL